MTREEKVIDILDKWEFFFGQRAGRTLWAKKPVDIQNQDIADFNRDVQLVRAALREQPRWISVEERLPSGWYIDKETGCREPEEYIVFVKGATLPTFANFIEGKFTRPDAIYCRDETGFADVITHWMPLPSAPKEEV